MNFSGTLTCEPSAKQGACPCPRCNGAGRIALRVYGERNKERRQARRDLICCRCGGHGQIQPPKERNHE